MRPKITRRATAKSTDASCNQGRGNSSSTRCYRENIERIVKRSINQVYGKYSALPTLIYAFIIYPRSELMQEWSKHRRVGEARAANSRWKRNDSRMSKRLIKLRILSYVRYSVRSRIVLFFFFEKFTVVREVILKDDCISKKFTNFHLKSKI